MTNVRQEETDDGIRQRLLRETEAEVERPLDQEARAVAAAARAWLEELAEEGLEALRLPDLEAAPASEPAPRAEPAAQEAPVVQPVLVDASGWGPETTLDDVRAVLGDCTRCRLHEGRSNLVFGDGNPEADLMFVGEGPGEQEDRRGLPFVGRAILRG